jgi:hypothetical protein
MNCFKIKNTPLLPLGNARNIPEPIMYFVTRENIIESTFQVPQSVKSLAMTWIVKHSRIYFASIVYSDQF